MASTSDLAACLSATLSPDPNTRISAELKLAEYFTSSDAGLSLSQLILAQDADISLRQISSRVWANVARVDPATSDQHSASILLQKYITERWSPFFPAFKGNAPPVGVKAQIRHTLFQGLSDKDRKIRSLCARALSSIANCDWPDEYPDLLSSLVNLLSSGSAESVHGSMQVFTEFIKSDLTEDQILPVLRDLLPVLLTILGSGESHSAPTRARTVSVFRQCVAALFMVKDQHPQAVKEAVASVLPVWLEAFKVLLSIDPQQDVTNANNWDGLIIRIQIFKTLDTIHTSFPRALTPYLKDFLTVSLNHLQTLYPTFAHYYIQSDDSVPRSSEEESIELPQLICPVTDFVAAVTRGGKARDWFDHGNLVALVSAVFRFVQMTNEDEETWATNANAFVAQEGDETQPYSVRVAGFDLLGCLIDRTPAQTAATFQSTIQQVVQESQQARDSGNRNWWRPLEAALASTGSEAEAIVDCVEDEQDSGRPKPIDIEYLLINVIPSVLNLSEFPFLQGRGFVFASQFAKLLPVQLAGQYLEAAIQVIEATEAGIPIKISAVKAVHNFCQGGDDSALVAFVPRIAKDLGPFLLLTSDDTLSLVLETLAVVIGVDGGKWLTNELANSLIIALLEVWNKNNKDFIFISILTDIFESIAGSPTDGVYQTVVSQALPTLSNAIGSARAEETWVASTAIELVTSLVKGSPGFLGEGFFGLLAPHLFKCLGETEDRDIIQNGIECLTLVVRKDCNQLLVWNDSNGRSGLDYVLTLVARMLEGEAESGGLAIGDLIIHLLRRAGEAVLPVLPQLLQAMVSRMTTAKTATFLQSLIIPFAFLINSQRDTVLSLLESTNIQGRSGLDILIRTWCENAETFQGFYPPRISTVALTQLFVSERQSLQNLMVKGDIIVNHGTKNVIMTRSRTKTTPVEFTSVPFPVKALKILLHDVQSGGESATITAQGEAYDVDSDDGDEEWTEEEKLNQGFKEDEFAFLSDMIGPRGMAFDNDDILEDDSDDEDLKNDPISQMDLQAHVVSFFQECASRNTSNFSAVVDQLTAEETLVVRRVVSTQ